MKANFTKIRPSIQGKGLINETVQILFTTIFLRMSGFTKLERNILLIHYFFHFNQNLFNCLPLLYVLKRWLTAETLNDVEWWPADREILEILKSVGNSVQ